MKNNTKIPHYLFFIPAFLVGAICYYALTGNSLPFSAPDATIIGSEDNPDAALSFRYNMIAGKTGFIPADARIQAIEHTLRYNTADKRFGKTAGITSWSAVGPGNVGGRIRAIIINPSNSNQLLVGAVAGGVWKSTNGGTSWSPKTDDASFPAISSMAYDPTNSNIVYAGTGEAWGNVDAVYGGGIYKSTDFGETWSILAATTGTWNFKNVIKLYVDGAGIVYAATKAYNYKGGLGSYYTNGGLYKSTNGGSSWTKISSTTSTTNYFNPSDVYAKNSDSILYAVKENGSTLGGIYRTTNGGTGWAKITSGLPTSSYSRISFATVSGSPYTLYAAIHSTVSGSSTYGLAGIYKSTDFGATWSVLTTPPRLASTSNRSYLGTQGWYDNVIAVDPFNTSRIYAAGVDMVRSTNGGSSWSQLTYWHSFYGSNVVHADHHVIAFDPNNSDVIYSGNDGGVYKTTNGGTSWTEMNNSLSITQFYGGAVSPTGSIYYGGTQDNGHLKYDGSGITWSEVYGGDGGYAALNQTNTSVAYEEYVYLDMSKTTDGGSNWTSCISGLTDANNSSNTLFIAPFSMNAENSSVLIAGSNKVWITSNDAGTWTQSSNTFTAGAYVTAVTVANGSSPFLGLAGTTNGKVYKCTSLDPASGIDTWTEITPTGNNGGYVRRVVYDPNDKQKLYACYSGFNDDNVTPSKHVFYSSNQGTSWADISGDLPDVPVHTIVVDQANPTTLYIGTETGIYQTTNRGTNWTLATSGMASYVPIDELVYQTGTNKLYAFTHGRSVFVTATPLPVELENFSGQSVEGRVMLSWQTATEKNSSHFIIERRLNTSEAWRELGKVNSSGNSNSPKQYRYSDNVVTASLYQYRLKMVDLDGSTQFSKPLAITVQKPIQFALLQNYPNPFNPLTNLRYSIAEPSQFQLLLYNATGECIATLSEGRAEAGYYTATVDAGKYHLSSGVYFVKLVCNTQSGKVLIQTRKIVLIK